MVGTAGFETSPNHINDLHQIVQDCTDETYQTGIIHASLDVSPNPSKEIEQWRITRDFSTGTARPN
jgi:hypothetical protein